MILSLLSRRLALITSRVLSLISIGGIAAPALGVETLERVLTPVFQQPVNTDANGDYVRLARSYRLEGKVLSMEAEGATVMRLVPDKGEIGKDAAASGGLYLAHVQHMEFQFEIPEAGSYTAWYRGWFPLKGNWCHTEKMDGGTVNDVTDSQGETLNAWIWCKGPSYELAKGQHNWQFTPSAWMGGTRLDKVLLVRDPSFKPEGLAAGASPATVSAGEIRTEPLAQRGNLKWSTLQIETMGARGTLTQEYSADNGGRWQPVPANGDLAAVPPEKEVVFRFKLAADPDGQAPILARARVTCAVKKMPEIVLENDVLQWRFAGETGALRGLRNQVTKTEYLQAGTEAPLFAFRALRGEYGVLRDVLFSQGDLKSVERPDPKTLRLAFELMGGGLRVGLTVRLEPEGLTRFSLEIANQTDYAIAETKFPILEGVRIGDDPKDDWICFPMLTGAITPYPASLERPHLLYTDRPTYWPGMATMCWMDLWDAQGGGLYVAGEDPEMRMTEIRCTPGGTKAMTAEGTAPAPLPPGEDVAYRRAAVPGNFVNLDFRKFRRIARPDGTVRMPDVVVGVHTGDWHWGADRYRAWAERVLKPAKTAIPDWFRDAEGWVDIHMTHTGTFVDLAKGRPYGAARKIEMRDPPFPVFAGWAQQVSSEAYWATPVLHRLLGSETEFAGGIRKQHEMGHRMMWYVLPPRINPVFEKGAKRNGCVPLSLIPPDEIPPKGFFSNVACRRTDGTTEDPEGVYSEGLACMGDARWRDYLKHIVVDKYVKTCGADGMYLDGMGLITYECRNLQHGHGYGEWHQGWQKWISETKSATRKIRPGAIFAGEGMGDVDHRYLDVGLFYFDNAPQVYRYALPWNLGVIHGAPFQHYKEYPNDWFDFIAVYGLKFGGVGQLFEQHPEKARQYVSFRKLFSQFQSRAVFRDEVGLRWSSPAVRGKLYLRDEAGTKGALIVAYNEKETAGASATVDAACVGKLASAHAYTLDGTPHPVEVRLEDGKYRVPLPASRLTAVLLLEKCEPFIDIARITPVAPQEFTQAKVTVRNLEAQPLRGTLALGLPRGWKSEIKKLEVAAGASSENEIRFEVPADASCDVHDIDAIVRDGKRETKKCIPLGVCRPVQAELHWVKPDTLRLEMGNAGSRPVKGTVTLALPASVTTDAREVPFALEPKGQGELMFRLKNVASVLTREHVQATLKYGKRRDEQTEAYELIQPPLPNGNFEQCLAGDGWPDYWNYRGPEDLYYKAAALDSAIFAEGRQSLRLEPNERSTVNHLGSTLLRLVPKTRYKLTGQIRRSAHHGGIGITFFAMAPKEVAPKTNVTIGQKKDGPVNVWETFSAEFTSADIVVPYEILMCNNGKSPATVWFDDIRIEEVNP